MKLNFEFQGEKIAYNLAYKKRSSIAIEVDKEGEVNVVAPIGTSLFSVMDKVKGYGAWILAEKAKIKQMHQPVEQFMYLGKNYGVEIVENLEKEKPSVKLVRGKFLVETKDTEPQAIREAVRGWVITKTEAKIKDITKKLAEHFEQVPKKVPVSYVPKKLFEVSSEGITLDVNCGICPTNVLECIMVEALCKYNGVTDLTGMLTKIVPEYQDAKKWIDENKTRFVFG